MGNNSKWYFCKICGGKNVRPSVNIVYLKDEITVRYFSRWDDRQAWVWEIWVFAVRYEISEDRRTVDAHQAGNGYRRWRVWTPPINCQTDRGHMENIQRHYRQQRSDQQQACNSPGGHREPQGSTWETKGLNTDVHGSTTRQTLTTVSESWVTAIWLLSCKVKTFHDSSELLHQQSLLTTNLSSGLFGEHKWCSWKKCHYSHFSLLMSQ